MREFRVAGRPGPGPFPKMGDENDRPLGEARSEGEHAIRGGATDMSRSVPEPPDRTNVRMQTTLAGPSVSVSEAPETTRPPAAAAARDDRLRCAALFLRDDHRLDGRGDTVDDIDDDHVRAHVLDRLGHVHVAFVDPQATGFADRRGDVLRRDRTEQAPVRAGLLGDRQHRAVQQVDVLLGFLDRLPGGALFGRLALADRFDRTLRGGLGELARDQVVAQVALGDVDHLALLAELLDVFEKDRFRHRGERLVPVPAAPRTVVTTALVHVRQQRELARALHGLRDLHLVAAARAGDPPRADLALLGAELAQRRDVLVFYQLALVLAVLAGLAPAAPGATPLVPAANRRAATARLRPPAYRGPRGRPRRGVLGNTVETSLCG